MLRNNNQDGVVQKPSALIQDYGLASLSPTCVVVTCSWQNEGQKDNAINHFKVKSYRMVVRNDNARTRRGSLLKEGDAMCSGRHTTSSSTATTSTPTSYLCIKGPALPPRPISRAFRFQSHTPVHDQNVPIAASMNGNKRYQTVH
jgi:hypothetical protein